MKAWAKMDDLSVILLENKCLNAFNNSPLIPFIALISRILVVFMPPPTEGWAGGIIFFLGHPV